jgi:hypothetical protein
MEFEPLPSDPDGLVTLQRLGYQEALEQMIRYQAGNITKDEWLNQMKRILTTYHTAAFFQGSKHEDLVNDDMILIAEGLVQQFEFLNKFSDDIVAGTDYSSRLMMYFHAIYQSFSRGLTAGMLLPAHPRDGTTNCLVRCCCHWRIEDQGNGDVDAFWILGECDHCGICPSRAQAWNPFQIRNNQWVDGQILPSLFKK